MNTILLGAQWGDEGKGKVVDHLSERADYVIRFQGGNNAGHSLWVGGKKTVLHLVPSGILHPHTVCVIGEGVVLDVGVLIKELAELKAAGVFKNEKDRIRISERVHLILPIHRAADQAREAKAKGTKAHIGTTGRGIGPAYETKAARIGIRAIDLFLAEQTLREKCEHVLAHFCHLFSEEELQQYRKETQQNLDYYKKVLEPLLVDTTTLLRDESAKGKRFLFEGAQGVMLDVGYGTYPYVTSSHTGSAAAGIGVGYPKLTRASRVLGIAKAYVTRVGSGDFVTEMRGEHITHEVKVAEAIRKAGAEFGATTGRPRRIGWQDLVALKYAVEVAGIDELAIMKGDVLCGLPELDGEFLVCIAYEKNGKRIDHFPAVESEFRGIKPIYKRMKLWQEARPEDSDYQAYLKLIESAVGVPVKYVGYGPERTQMAVLS